MNNEKILEEFNFEEVKSLYVQRIDEIYHDESIPSKIVWTDDVLNQFAQAIAFHARKTEVKPLLLQISGEHVAYLRFKQRADNKEAYLQICDSDAEGAFKVWRGPIAQKEEIQSVLKALKRIRDFVEFGPFYGEQATNSVIECDEALASYHSTTKSKL